jgi:hypothetical protein
MKIRALFVLASFVGMLIAGGVLESRAPSLSGEWPEAKPKCQTCR